MCQEWEARTVSQTPCVPKVYFTDSGNKQNICVKDNWRGVDRNVVRFSERVITGKENRRNTGTRKTELESKRPIRIHKLYSLVFIILTFQVLRFLINKVNNGLWDLFHCLHSLNDCAQHKTERELRINRFKTEHLRRTLANEQGPGMSSNARKTRPQHETLRFWRVYVEKNFFSQRLRINTHYKVLYSLWSGLWKRRGITVLLSSVVEGLPHTCKALGLIPSTTKERKKV